MAKPIESLSAPEKGTVRTALGLGTLATQSGTFSGTSSGTNTGDQTDITGNAGTATALQTARTINGVSFNGTANITVTAAAGTLTGSSLASGVTSSSLTSFGTGPTLTNASETAQTLTDAATVNWNMNNGGYGKVTLGGNRTMAAPTNLREGACYILRVAQDGTGSRTITWNAVFKWPGGVAPTLSTAAGAVDIITFISDGTYLYGTASLAFA